MANLKEQQTGQMFLRPAWRHSGRALAAAVPLIAGCVSFAHLTRQGESFPRAEACGACHVDIYREWTASPHAHAFTTQSFRDATDNYRFERCLGLLCACHCRPSFAYGLLGRQNFTSGPE